MECAFPAPRSSARCVCCTCCSVAECDSLRPHELQRTRLPWPSQSPGISSDSCPLSRWCHPTISSSVTHFFFCPQSFPASGSFPVSWAPCLRWPKYWSFSLSISPSNEYSGLISFRIDWFDLLAVQGSLKSLLQHNSEKASFFGTQRPLWSDS